jgi:sialate O-acetylesterase
MTRGTWLLVVCIFISVAAWSEVRLPALVGDHMVLQQQSEVLIWGWCNPGEEVTVRPSWGNRTYSTIGTNMAKWEVTVQTPVAGGPFQIEIVAGESIILDDVLIGEVWICSGQSNMDWSANHGFDHAEEETQRTDNPKIRFFQVPRTTAA